MMELHDSKTVTTRKPHHCEYCGSMIPRGSFVEYEKGKFDGDFFSRYTCCTCEPLVLDFWHDHDYECFDILENFSEWVKDRDMYHPAINKLGGDAS